ncbi:MAG: hypothetical protein GC191_16125 [Azospirillum sp.]|nr:hypothetical protein [Azospirillum sp.]
MFRAIPLLVIVFVIYNVIAFTAPGMLSTPVLPFTLPSGSPWKLSVSELISAFGLILLYLEILKSTRTSLASVIDHAMSLLLFIVCLIEFLVAAPASTGTFFLITLMTLLDVVAGFTVTISAARRDIDVGRSL